MEVRVGSTPRTDFRLEKLTGVTIWLVPPTPRRLDKVCARTTGGAGAPVATS